MRRCNPPGHMQRCLAATARSRTTIAWVAIPTALDYHQARDQRFANWRANTGPPPPERPPLHTPACSRAAYPARRWLKVTILS